MELVRQFVLCQMDRAVVLVVLTCWEVVTEAGRFLVATTNSTLTNIIENINILVVRSLLGTHRQINFQHLRLLLRKWHRLRKWRWSLRLFELEAGGHTQYLHRHRGLRCLLVYGIFYTR